MKQKLQELAKKLTIRKGPLPDIGGVGVQAGNNQGLDGEPGCTDHRPDVRQPGPLWPAGKIEAVRGCHAVARGIANVGGAPDLFEAIFVPLWITAEDEAEDSQENEPACNKNGHKIAKIAKIADKPPKIPDFRLVHL